MQDETRGFKQHFLKNVRIIYLSYGLLMYILGICIVDYLNIQIDWTNALLGYLVILFMQILEGLINLTKTSSFQKKDQKEIFKKQTQLALIAFLMMILAFLIVSLSLRGGLTGAGWLFIVLLGLICILRPGSRPVGELAVFREIIEAVVTVGIIPSFAFNLTSGELHPFLLFINIPLLFIFLGTQIALAFPQYKKEVTRNIPSLLIQTGWQRGIFLHDILLTAGYLCLGIFGLIGLPWDLLWPTMMVSAIGIFEIILLHRIGEGEKPNWKLLRLVAHGLIGLSIYTMIFSLLIN